MNPNLITDLIVVIQKIKKEGFRWDFHKSVYITAAFFLVMLFLFFPLKALFKAKI